MMDLENLESLMGQLGISEEMLQKMAADPMGMLSELLEGNGIQPEAPENPDGESEPADVAPEMPTEEETAQLSAALQEEFGGLFSQMSDLLGGAGGLQQLFGMGGFDLEEAVEEYEPEAEDAADRALVQALKTWISETLQALSQKQICMLNIAYHPATDAEGSEAGTVGFGFNTEETDRENRSGERADSCWNPAVWTESRFCLLDEAPLAAWRKSQGYDPSDPEEAEEMITRIYDLAAVAVMELHREQATERIFGRKLPFVIEGETYTPQTAIRAVRVNGKALFDEAFFAQCGAAPGAEA